MDIHLVGATFGQHRHRLVRVPSMAQELGHQVHRWIDVREEGLVACAQVVQPGLAIRRREEAVFRALAVAREADRAVTAILRQRVAFDEPALSRGV